MKIPSDRTGMPTDQLLRVNHSSRLLRLIRPFASRNKSTDSFRHVGSGRDYLTLISSVRNRHILLLDLVALLFIPFMAMALRLEGLNWAPEVSRALALYTLVATVVQVAIFYRLGLYRRIWRYAGINELAITVATVGLSTVILTIFNASLLASPTTRDLATYRTIPVIAGLLTLVAAGGFRFGVRGLYDWHKHQKSRVADKRTLVAGAGEAGMMIVREIRTNPTLNMDVVAFVDDDPQKVGSWIAGLPVVGNFAKIPETVNELAIQEVIVAIPTAPLARQRQVITLSKRSGASVTSPPGIFELLAGFKTISQVPYIDLHSLLEREPITTDQSDVVEILQGTRVMVTGAGGSIGSELCHQIAASNPAEIILLGHGENSIFQASLNLRLAFPELANHTVITDIRDDKGVDWAFNKYRPDIVFHAAAHKHVPFMEANVSEAITNNVQGTFNLLRSAKRHGVKRFVLISSDKAVNPTSIMGATKRITELLIKATARESGQSYMAVRFGNVLGSRGSVVPVFQRQIQAGGPVTITHPEMRRYFMTVAEAVQLVLQAAALGEGGQVYTLDMGEQVRIMDLAAKLIKRSGFVVGRDIDIVITGIRPGEKLAEELFLNSEDYSRTKHEKLFVATDNAAIDSWWLNNAIAELIELARRRQIEDAIRKMQMIAPSYNPQLAGPAPVDKASENRQRKVTTSKADAAWRNQFAQV